MGDFIFRGGAVTGDTRYNQGHIRASNTASNLTNYTLVDDEGSHGVVLVTDSVDGDYFELTANGVYFISLSARALAGTGGVALFKGVVADRPLSGTVLPLESIAGAAQNGCLSATVFSSGSMIVWPNLSTGITTIDTSDVNFNQITIARVF